MKHTLDTLAGTEKTFYSLQKLASDFPNVKRLPKSLLIVLESLLRNNDGKRVLDRDVENLAKWTGHAERVSEIPFVVSRVVLQDFTGVPLLVDLAAMRKAVHKVGGNPSAIEPLVPVDLVVDHSIQVDAARQKNALDLNMKLEFQRNKPRYEFLKWGTQAFETFKIVPPGNGIVHQVNLEYLAQGVLEKVGVVYPDSLVGTDSHTTMINGLGVVGWGVGGIEAEAAMLGQPVYFLTPDVVGVHMKGKLREGITATDLVLYVTELLRKTKVVGKFVEFFGVGAQSLPIAERATLANMAPEYGATMGYFPIDQACSEYLSKTGRSATLVKRYEAYYRAQNLFGIPLDHACDYSQVVEVDLSDVDAAVAGPKRPQDRIAVRELKTKWGELLTSPSAYAKSAEDTSVRIPVDPRAADEPINLKHGDVVIAAITSCTNTSNPAVMLAAGLLARNARSAGLVAPPYVKTSLAPGSRVVTEYLKRAGLLESLEAIGFGLVGYGCTTCIGNSGPLHPSIENAIKSSDLVVTSVLSGNRNFEARVHPNVKANFLMSPPLVVAYALAGTVDIDFKTQPLGHNKKGAPVFLRDIWPSMAEVASMMDTAMDPKTFRRVYDNVLNAHPLWQEIPMQDGQLYRWDATSTYIKEPPFFESFSMTPSPVSDIVQARPLAVFGDSITTDHISPAGSIDSASPAALHLLSLGVQKEDFNSYGSRRGNHEIMMRGTFANVRIRNLMMGGKEGGFSKYQGIDMPIYDVAMKYQADNVPLVVFAGQEYGTGSSRDWAAKGTALLGIKAVIAKSFERIHRSNLVGMGVLPCELPAHIQPQELGLNGSELITIRGLSQDLSPKKRLSLKIERANGNTQNLDIYARIDTPIEVEYFNHGGILPYVLRQILS